jgi:predicted NBD/HSP70 family sugar kinase
VGIKVGRRSMDLLLVDFTGAVRERWSTDYRYPDPDLLRTEIGLRLRELRRKLGPTRRALVQGVGIAAPLSLGGWQTLLDMPPEVAEKWHRSDLRAEVAALTDWPVELLKDTAAACVAELVAGRGRSVKSFLYVFVDTFIGGGLVIDSHLRAGIHGNAGAVGSLPLGLAKSDAAPAQLLSVASLFTLERRYADAGLDASAAADERALQKPWDKHTQRWLDDAATAIALSINSAACLLDLDGVIIDGSFGRELLQALLGAVDEALERYSWEGVLRPRLLPGTIGSDARALGGALMPLYANFAPDRELFLKVAA